MMKKMSLIILCMFLLINIPHSALFDIFPEEVCGGELNSFMSSWAVTCYIAILVSLGILLLIFFVCRFLNIQKGELWSKYELIQVGATILILIFIVGFSEFILCNPAFTPKLIFGDIPGAGDGTMIDEANSYLQNLIYMNTFSLVSLTFISVIRESVGNLKLSANILGIGGSITPFKGLNSFDRSMELTYMGLITVLITSITQRMLFAYVFKGMFTIFLPIGILLRCFEPTRRFGGTLIGLTIALGLFWPLLLVANNIALGGIGFIGLTEQVGTYINDHLEELEIVDFQFNSPKDIISMDGNKFTFMGLGRDIITPIQIDIITPIQTMFGAFQMLVWKILAINILGSLFLPLVNFAILAASIREFSRFFGDQIDLSNLTRMI